MITLPRAARRPSQLALLAIALACGRAVGDEKSCCNDPEQLCPVVAEPLPAATSTAKPGEEDIEVSSQGAELSRTGDAVLKGKVDVRQGDRRLSAEDVQYDNTTQSLKVEGNVEYQDPLVRVRGASGTYDAAGGATFGEAQFELPSRPARGSAKEIAVKRDGHVTLDEVKYTTCPAGNQDWVLRAGNIDLDTAERNGSGRGIRLDFKGVPILYTPYISFPIGDERKSGFLFPEFGVSSKNGVQVGLPYYFNLAPNYDLGLTPRYWSDRGFMLESEFRYLGHGDRGDLDAVALPNDRLRHEDRSYIHWTHLSDFWERWRFTADAANASDANYFEDFGQGSAITSTLFVKRDAELRYYGEHWSLLGQAENFQTIDQTIADESRPYTILPRLLARGLWQDTPLGLEYEVDGELVNFDRNIGVTGARLDVEPEIRWPLRRPGFYLVPEAAYRYTTYDLSNVAPGQPTSPSRSAPIYSLDTGLTFERIDTKRIITFEPRLLYLYVPFRDQTDLPVFDTAIPDLNLVELFRRNRYVGADRLSDANQLSGGITARFLDTASGRQYLSATLGETWYFTSPQVVLPDEVPTNRDYSNFIGELELSAYRDWNIRMGIEYNPVDTRAEKGQVSVQYKPAPQSVVNVGYRFRRDLIEQVDGSIAWPIARRWNIYSGIVYSLKDESLIDEFAGFEYASCCWRVRLVQRRYVSSRTGERDSSVALQLELTGLSSVGVPADAFLSNAIRGYSRTRPDE
ncbi:MAG TPA: LPS assembly protein LptD [Steroidobacteraceae bacterium]|nr:LPS assembly protein LptD [Steroidobacteraceae bacterium]